MGSEHQGEPAAFEVGEVISAIFAAFCWEYPVDLCLGWCVCSMSSSGLIYGAVPTW